MKVRFAPRARDDLRGILCYIDAISPAGSHTVRRAFRRSIALIARFPGIGRSAGEGGARVLPVGRYPYLIYWEVIGDALAIVHVRHAKRERPPGV